MRIVLSFFLVLVSSLALKAEALENRASSLTASELSEVLGIHWWIVELPSNLGPKDHVCISFVDSNGNEVAAGSSFSPGPANIKLGPEAKVFCWEDKASGQIKVTLQVANNSGTSGAQNFFDKAATGGPANGTVLKPGDVLIKFDSSKGANFTGGNEMHPGQIALKIVVNHSE